MKERNLKELPMKTNNCFRGFCTGTTILITVLLNCQCAFGQYQNTNYGEDSGTHGDRTSNFGAFAGGLADGNANTNIGFETQYNPYESTEDLNYGPNNVNVGAYAGSVYYGQDNTFLGYQVGSDLQFTSYNTYVGANSAYESTNNANKNKNVFLGFNSGRRFTFPDGDVNLFILNNQASMNKPLLYGEFYQQEDELVQLGIGTKSLLGESVLTVEGNATINGAVTADDVMLDREQTSLLFEEGNVFGLYSVVSNFGQPRVVIEKSHGNIGIGLIPPASDKLSVNGDILIRGFNYEWAHWDNIRMFSNGGYANIEMDGDEHGTVIKSQIGKKISLIAGNVSAQHGETVDEKIKGQFTVIGPTFVKYHPGENGTKLDKYQLWVEKGIMAEDFAISSIANWPDFVFSDAYRLPGIDEVENFIKIHGHLPGINAAEFIKENGVELSDLTVSLLQKIEELTLYKIKQEQKAAEQRARLEAIQEQIVLLTESSNISKH